MCRCIGVQLISSCYVVQLRLMMDLGLSMIFLICFVSITRRFDRQLRDIGRQYGKCFQVFSETVKITRYVFVL
jgi:hypothetical protein